MCSLLHLCPLKWEEGRDKDWLGLGWPKMACMPEKNTGGQCTVACWNCCEICIVVYNYFLYFAYLRKCLPSGYGILWLGISSLACAKVRCGVERRFIPSLGNGMHNAKVGR